jgi:hypothetical protein
LFPFPKSYPPNPIRPANGFRDNFGNPAPFQSAGPNSAVAGGKKYPLDNALRCARDNAYHCRQFYPDGFGLP